MSQGAPALRKPSRPLEGLLSSRNLGTLVRKATFELVCSSWADASGGTRHPRRAVGCLGYQASDFSQTALCHRIASWARSTRPTTSLRGETSTRTFSWHISTRPDSINLYNQPFHSILLVTRNAALIPRGRLSEPHHLLTLRDAKRSRLA